MKDKTSRSLRFALSKHSIADDPPLNLNTTLSLLHARPLTASPTHHTIRLPTPSPWPTRYVCPYLNCCPRTRCASGGMPLWRPLPCTINVNSHANNAHSAKGTPRAPAPHLQPIDDSTARPSSPGSANRLSATMVSCCRVRAASASRR